MYVDQTFKIFKVESNLPPDLFILMAITHIGDTLYVYNNDSYFHSLCEYKLKEIGLDVSFFYYLNDKEKHPFIEERITSKNPEYIYRFNDINILGYKKLSNINDYISNYAHSNTIFVLECARKSKIYSFDIFDYSNNALISYKLLNYIKRFSLINIV